MFDANTFEDRRDRLKHAVGGGLAVFIGNDYSPMNFAANVYPFRQDPSFRYFFGLNEPRLAAVIDTDTGSETLYGDDASMEEVVWSGPKPSITEQAALVGVAESRPFRRVFDDVQSAIGQGRTIHFLPQYRAENSMLLAQATGLEAATINAEASAVLRDAVIALRSVKSGAEIEQLDEAVALSGRMHRLAMSSTQPGSTEGEIAAATEALAEAEGSHVAYPLIVTRRGEVLHNESRSGRFAEGDLVLCDAGATSPLGYAADITRTYPVGATFATRQREIYELVLAAHEQAIEAIRPGVAFIDIHRQAARRLVTGLKALGLMRGQVDEAVAAGAHALFFPHGLGHMLGLDVHDMEALGEDYVGYDGELRRASQFGLDRLRLGRRLERGFVLTVEPGLYFIPGLIDQWRAGHRHEAYINYDNVGQYRDFGGVRIEDDIVVLEDGARVLGPAIPREVAAVEAAALGD